MVTNNPFVNAIANGKELVAFPEQTGVLVVNLTGTKKAIEQIEACNKGPVSRSNWDTSNAGRASSRAMPRNSIRTHHENHR